MSDILNAIGIIFSIGVSFITIITFLIDLKFKLLFPRFKLKRKLKKYKRVRLDEKKEKEQARKIASLLLKGQRRFKNYDFSYTINNRHGDIIVKGLYKIHLTPPEGVHSQQFLISRVDGSSEAYFSEGYPKAKNVKSNITTLEKFIDFV